MTCKLPGSPRTQNSSHTSPSSASAPNTLDVDLSEHDFEFVRCFLEGTDPYELLTPEVSLERVLTFCKNISKNISFVWCEPYIFKIPFFARLGSSINSFTLSSFFFFSFSGLVVLVVHLAFFFCFSFSSSFLLL